MAENAFGGQHSDQKVDIVRLYLEAYTTALKKQSFTLIYIDPFAGTGERTHSQGPLPLFAKEGEKVVMPGSASVALSVKPQFDVVVLIDANPSYVNMLEELRLKHPDRNIAVRTMDANQALKAITKHYDWASSRAVVFLDPYGMEVEWSTLEAIKATGAIDLWYLFPTHAVLRQAPIDPSRRDGSKEAALTRLFGSSERWKRILYPTTTTTADLFDDGPKESGRASVQARDVEEAFRLELEKLFSPGYVCKRPHRVMMRIGRRKVHAYSLFFAVANPNPKACRLAARIAEAILKPK